MLKIFLILLPSLIFAHPMNDLEKAYTSKDKNYTPRTKHIKNGKAKFVNHLILENSPYLLQHAHNPVNWYSFSDEAFAKAKKENKPIFISIGYATCHWCHVMEEESFDDIEVAKILNEGFVAIKVDREIRPDIDSTYMNVAMALNGSGGWPLNAVLLPNGDSFFAGTYFPKKDLISVLTQIKILWLSSPERIKATAVSIKKSLNINKINNKSAIDKNVNKRAISAILNNFDELDGGFGNAPKFPRETTLLLLLDEQHRNPSEEKLEVITTTLDAMAYGGIYDVVGGGFHRYSTDNTWLVPHFEKMLYNQAQLSLVYMHGFELTKKPLYKRIATKTLDYVLREMANKTGGFFSATDADSEGEEGTFFIWSKNEIKDILGDDFNEFKKFFDLSSNTEFEGGNIIRYKDITTITKEDYGQIDKLLDKLYKVRKNRIPPLLDYKSLLSWNALLVPAFIEAGEVFEDNKYTKAGLDLADYLNLHFYKDNKLHRALIKGKLEADALSEDYAYLANAYLKVFDYTFDKAWLDRTIKLVNIMQDRFWDNGFNIAQNNNFKQAYDGAIPATNGIIYQVLNKLANRDANKEYKDLSVRLLNAFADKINKNPYNYSSFILGFNNANFGEIATTKYAYNGRVQVKNKQDKNENIITIKLKLGWHINSNKPLQKELIATKISGKNITSVSYPQGEIEKLGFSKENISVYKNQVKIKINGSPQQLSLTLQACSDRVCLPPTTVDLF